MQTYTHFLLALAFSGPLSSLVQNQQHRLPPLHVYSFLFGSVLPDLPLIVTTIVCVIIDKIEKNHSVINLLFGDWYFHNPWVKAEHNVFHSQITLLSMLLLAYILWRRGGHVRASWVFWALLSSWVHATSDIPVHHDDGPLIFFPLNWDYRFRSPLSYWDPKYHGRQFAVCEHIIDALIIVRQCWICMVRPKCKQASKTGTELAPLTTNQEDSSII